jgi:hypothetical protein
MQFKSFEVSLFYHQAALVLKNSASQVSQVPLLRIQK